MLFVLIYSGLSIALPASATKNISKEAIPEWVIEPVTNRSEKSEDSPGQVDYELMDYQSDVSSRTSFFHIRYKILEAGALSWAAERSFEYDPAFEKLVFHHIHVIRDGEVQDRLDINEMEVFRQEREMDRALYNGRLTAVLQLKDVRVGDTIDYAYSIQGQNPVLEPGYFRMVNLGRRVPVRHLHRRIVSPLESTLHFHVHGPDDFDVQSTNHEGKHCIVIHHHNVKPTLVESDTPTWHMDYPMLQLTSFSKWSEVVEWALPLYKLPEAQADEIHAALQQIVSKNQSPEEQLLTALDFVQNQVRYLSVSLGTGSYQPRPPTQTLTNRFGDCKDKTLLFCAFAQALGFKAYPALVHTDFGQRLFDEWLPSPQSFDHVIAVIERPDGTLAWFDPTSSYHAGDLIQRSSPDYGYALIVKPGQKDLTRMETPEAANPKIVEHMFFTSQGLNQPALLEIHTEYHGHEARYQRGLLAAENAEELGKKYVNYYQHRLPGLEMTKPISWKDDTEKNILTVHEFYKVPSFWKEEEPGFHTAFVKAWLIQDKLHKAETILRKRPLAVSHPEEWVSMITLSMHEPWNLTKINEKIEGPALLFESNSQVTNNVISLTYRLKTLKGWLPPELVLRHIESINEILNNIGFSLSNDTRETQRQTSPDAGWFMRINRYATLISLLVLTGGFFVLAYVLNRKRKTPPALPVEGPKGLGGWLIFPLLGLIASLIHIPVNLISAGSVYYSQKTWDALVTKGLETYDPLLAALLLVEPQLNLLIWFVVLISLILFFKRRHETPYWIIGFMVANIFISVWDLVVTMDDNLTKLDTKSLSRSLFGACIWIPYFLKSIRVKNTFTR